MASLYGQGMGPAEANSHGGVLAGPMANANAWESGTPGTPSEVQPGSLANLLGEQQQQLPPPHAQQPFVGSATAASPHGMNAL